MNTFFILLAGILTILLSKKLLGKWFNHLSLYSAIWMVMIYLYELKLIRFASLSTQTWIIISASFISFILGIITILSARSALGESNYVFYKDNVKLFLFDDNGKLLKSIIYTLAFIGLFAAIQHWQVLIAKWGSIPNVLLHSYDIYTSRLTGTEPKGIIPYLWLASYFAVFFAGIYTAYKGKITFVAVLPLIGIVLKESARLTRSGILFGLFYFVISFLLYRHLINKSNLDAFRLSKYKIIIATMLAIILMVGAAALVKVVRNPIENIRGTTRELKKLEENVLVSPSIYFYASSQVGVLNKYLDKEDEIVPFGNSTFFPIYSQLSKLGFVSKPRIQHRGYFIPHWSNTATFLRDLHADFGYAGLFFFPFLLGLISTYFWFRFYQSGSLYSLLFLTHSYLIIAMSFFVLATRFPVWFYGLLFIPVIVKGAHIMLNNKKEQSS